MKNSLFILIVIFILSGCGNKDTCSDNCRKKESVSSASNAKTVVSDTSKGLSCKLTSEELEERKANVLSVIKKKVLDKKELGNGYSFKFENTDEMIDMLTDFVKSERQCCNFFNFAIHINNDGSLWFDLTGPKEVKEMISSELEL